MEIIVEPQYIDVITDQHKVSPLIVIVDEATNEVLRRVKSFNIKTKEVEFYELQNNCDTSQNKLLVGRVKKDSNGAPLTVKKIIPTAVIRFRNIT